jgi:hypothetical protein
MVIATDEAAPQFGAHVVLHHRRAAKLASPDNESLIEKTALLEVGQQSGDGAIDLAALDRKRLIEALPGDEP